MNKDLTQIDKYLPYFYPKSQHIALKLNPLLKNIRENHINSFKQF